MTSPPARFAVAMTHSADRDRVVLFGGRVGSTYASDTWEYDGSTWTEVSTLQRPPEVAEATLTDDLDNHRLVLVGGTDGGAERDEVWEYNGTWERKRVFVGPEPRTTPLAFDSVRDRVMLFSGYGSNVVNDLWEFDGATWTALDQGADRPATRHYHVFAYHAASDRLLVYGGRNSAFATITDDWTWNGTAWSEVPGTAPPARWGAGAAYHEDDEVIVVFGGTSGPNQPLGDTWEFDGTAWTQITGSGPAPQRFVSMAYDPEGKRIVAMTAEGTYAYANQAWSMLTPTPPWPTRSYAHLAFDDGRGSVVAYGGQAPDLTAYNDAWELDQTTWKRIGTSGDSPTPSVFNGWVGDPANRQLVLFGGQTASDYHGETWILQQRSSTPDEACTGGVDDDGDGLIDGADPDCPP